MNQKKTEFFVNRIGFRLKGRLKGWVGLKIFSLLILILLLVACVDLTNNSPTSKVKHVEVNEGSSKRDASIKINETFNMLKKKLSIPVLKPSYLPKGYFVSSRFDVHENNGKNPQIVNDKHAEVELEKTGYNAASEYGHKWLRFSFGNTADIANYSTPGIYINGSPAMYVGGKAKSWAIISWIKVWKGKKIRYAVEGSGIKGEELIKIANSMKPL